MAMFFNRIIALFMSFLAVMPWNIFSAGKRAEDFRVVAYVVGSTFEDKSKIDTSHFSQITDVILIGVSDFNEKGEIILNKKFDRIYKNLIDAIGDNKVNIHLNLIGPGATDSSATWEEQNAEKSEHHNNAFHSGKLENNIRTILKKYNFDGVFFDYEYPASKSDWAVLDEFLISLDNTLGDEYKIGCAISAWNTEQSKEAIKVLDMVEVMAYDFWDPDDTCAHASDVMTKCCVAQMLLDGYTLSQMDLGLPFYARPTNQGAYWYDYKGYSDEIDENGFYYDKATDLTFSFNTYDMIYDKTQWAIKLGMGGTMVWHYSCDTPASDESSLFNAIYAAKTSF